MDPLMTVTDVPWAPTPNTLTIVPSPLVPESGGPVTSVSALVFDAADCLLLTRVAARGWDLPGGHVEDGESPEQAMVRELAEETGLVLEPGEDLHVAGVLALHVAAPRPAGYRYPHPDSQMPVFTARLGRVAPDVAPIPGIECTHAAWVARVDVSRWIGPRAWQGLLAHVTAAR